MEILKLLEGVPVVQSYEVLDFKTFEGGWYYKMKVVWTEHARERLTQWNEQRGVTREEVERVVEEPEQVVSGRGEAQVAQARRGPGLLRIPFVEEGEEQILLTLYWAIKTDKYWRQDL